MMSQREEKCIRQELEKRFPNLDDDIDEGGASRTYRNIYDLYNAMDGDPEAWSLTEIMDADTLKRKWVWRKKS